MFIIQTETNWYLGKTQTPDSSRATHYDTTNEALAAIEQARLVKVKGSRSWVVVLARD